MHVKRFVANQLKFAIKGKISTTISEIGKAEASSDTYSS